MSLKEEDAIYTLWFKADDWYIFGNYGTLEDAICRGDQSYGIPFRVIKWLNQGIVYEYEGY